MLLLKKDEAGDDDQILYLLDLSVFFLFFLEKESKDTMQKPSESMKGVLLSTDDDGIQDLFLLLQAGY
jgi:hypothetical protein